MNSHQGISKMSWADVTDDDADIQPISRVNAWMNAPKIVPCPDPTVILANIPKSIPIPMEEAKEDSVQLSRDEWNQIRTQGFETMQDPEKRKAILYKTSACRHGVDCERFNNGVMVNGVKCDFYHYATERRIPMCPFKQTCTSSGCNHCHPGQEDMWLKRNPLPAGCPTCKPVSKPVSKPSYKRKPVPKQGPVRIEASLFKTDPESANLSMQAAMNMGREIIIVQD